MEGRWKGGGGGGEGKRGAGGGIVGAFMISLLALPEHVEVIDRVLFNCDFQIILEYLVPSYKLHKRGLDWRSRITGRRGEGWRGEEQGGVGRHGEGRVGGHGPGEGAEGMPVPHHPAAEAAVPHRTLPQDCCCVSLHHH